jgi:hypothetical protein
MAGTASQELSLPQRYITGLRALSCLVAALAAAICALPAQAAGPIEKRRDELPKPIGKLHTCVGWRDAVHWRPVPERAGSAGVIMSASCPLDGPGVAAAPSQKKWQQHQQLALYLARNKAGAGARRIVLPYPTPDGGEVAVNVVPVTPSIGWSTRAQTSGLHKAAYLDRHRTRLPAGEFHLLMQLYPADRPHLKSAIAIWHVTMRGAATLIYWAETTEELRGEYPHYVYPQYVTVLDARPQK